jgi:Ubiquitin carboxyl-terminal hydrolase
MGAVEKVVHEAVGSEVEAAAEAVAAVVVGDGGGIEGAEEAEDGVTADEDADRPPDAKQGAEQGAEMRAEEGQERDGVGVDVGGPNDDVDEVLDERLVHPAAVYKSRVVPELFQGGVETVTRCLQCENANSRAESFFDVSLPVEIGRSLTWALATHGKDEFMDGSNKYACSHCNTYQEARQCWRLSHIPPLFTVHLKLFAFATARPLGAKVPAAMSCPFALRLSRWCTRDCAQRNFLYRLTSIIVHDGSTSSSGHYYAYVKVVGRGWFVFDDSDVTPTNEDIIRGELFTSLEARNTAYLLFYECEAPGRGARMQASA